MIAFKHFSFAASRMFAYMKFKQDISLSCYQAIITNFSTIGKKFHVSDLQAACIIDIDLAAVATHHR